MKKHLLDTNPTPGLRAHVVWVPKRGGRSEHVPRAAGMVSDRRASHYWDESGAAMRAYTAVLALPEDAWDIYMAYGPGAKWEGALPPKPDFWMHQLGEREAPRVAGPYLDAGVFAAEAVKLLGTTAPAPTP